jgi:glutathione peroxidase
MKLYDFTANDIDGNPVKLDAYKGKVMLVVNTASKCGFTPQYEDLQRLYDDYQEKGLEILGFPCGQFMDQEFEERGDIKSFCALNFGVQFPIFEKIDVNGSSAHPIFEYLKEQAPFEGFDMSNPTNKVVDSILNEKFPAFTIGDAIRWNFTKFLVDRDGNVIQRFESSVSPLDIESHIEKLL